MDFQAEKKMVNGKECMVFKVKSETITHPDGRQDVIIHAPNLGMISEFMKKQEAANGIGNL